MQHLLRFLQCFQPGFRVLELGADYGHLTLLLSDLVGDAGHVVASSKNPIPKGVSGVNGAISEWLRRDGQDEGVDLKER